MTRQEMAEAVCAKVGQTDDESVAVCGRFLNARWQQVWDSAPWRESLGVAYASTEGAEGIVLVPGALERVLAVRGGAGTLQPMELPVMLQYDAGLWEAAGEACWFATLPPVALTGSPSGGAAPVGVTSAYASPTAERLEADKGKLVYVAGEDARGDFVEETFPLVVQLVPTEDLAAFCLGGETATAFRVVTAISKPVTENALFVGWEVSQPNLPEQAMLRPGETRARKLQRIRLMPQPAEGTGVLLLGKRRFAPLGEAQSQPALRGTANVLMALAAGDMLERQRQYAKAQLKFQEGAAQLALLVELERSQSANGQRLVPAEIHGGSNGIEGW